MRRLDRAPEPALLARKKHEWTAEFGTRRASAPTARPDPRRYGHEDVRRALRATSHHKCFYCERELAEGDEEVDHYREVAQHPQLAFDWQNLYLSCAQCNNKKPSDAALPVAGCADPCAAPGAANTPEAHLTFHAERVTPRNGSAMGRATLRKYNLDRQELNLARLRALFDVLAVVHEVELRATREQRPLTDDECALLVECIDVTRPFSAMLRAHLEPELRRLGALSAPAV